MHVYMIYTILIYMVYGYDMVYGWVLVNLLNYIGLNRNVAQMSTITNIL